MDASFFKKALKNYEKENKMDKWTILGPFGFEESFESEELFHAIKLIPSLKKKKLYSLKSENHSSEKRLLDFIRNIGTMPEIKMVDTILLMGFSGTVFRFMAPVVGSMCIAVEGPGEAAIISTNRSELEAIKEGFEELSL